MKGGISFLLEFPEPCHIAERAALQRPDIGEAIGENYSRSLWWYAELVLQFSEQRWSVGRGASTSCGARHE